MKFLSLSSITTLSLIALSFGTPATLHAQTNTPTPTVMQNFPTLPRDFDSDFRFSNQYGLSGKIAFTAKIGKYDRILLLDLDQKRVLPLIDGPGNNSFPAWSPDGMKLAFTSDRDGNPEIYVSNADGSEQKRLTNNKTTDDHPDWTPDGSEVLFYSDNGKSGGSLVANIYAVGVDGKPARQITNFKGKNSTPHLSKDGNTLIYSTNRFWPGWDICFLDMKTHQERCPLSGTATYCRPAWSRSGDKIAFSTAFLSQVSASIFNMEDSETAELPEHAGKQYDVTWSPDDKFIAFASDYESSDNYDIWVQELNKESEVAPIPLLRSKYSTRYLTWTGSPNKKTISKDSTAIAQE